MAKGRYVPGVTDAPSRGAETAAVTRRKGKVQAFRQRRLKAERALAIRVNAGKMSPTEAHTKLQKLGFVPGGAAEKKPVGAPGLAARVIGGTAERVVDKAKGAVSAIEHPQRTAEQIRGHGLPDGYKDWPAERKRAYLKSQTGKLKRGELRVNAGVVSPGTGLLAQTAAGFAQSATYNPAGAVEAVKHPVRTAKQVGKQVERIVTHPLERPDQTALLAWALLSGGGATASRLAGAGNALRAGEGAGAALTRPGHAGGSLLHTPEPGTHPLYAPGAPPESGIGPVPATQVDRLLSRNVVARKLVQEPRNRRLQKSLDRGAPAMTPKTKAGRFVRDNFSAQATVGREIRATRRVTAAKAQGPVTAQQRAVHGVFTLGNVSRGENTALQVAAIEGHGALKNPREAIFRHIATHERFIAEGKDVAANQAMIRDLKLAGHALEHPSDKFKAALAQTADLSAETERKLIKAGHLNAETAQGRKDKIAKLYGHEAAPEGSFFYPLSRRYTENVPRVGGSTYSPRPTEAGGIGPPRPGQAIAGLRKEFTGKSVENAQRPISVADATADRATRTNKLLDQEKVYEDMWHIATPTRVSEHQIPIRSTPQVKSATRKFFAQLHDHLHAHPDEAAALNLDEAASLQKLLEAAEHKTAAVGAKVDGVRWVDKRYLKDLGENSVRGPFEKALDAVTNPVRATSLYLRPAYALNFLGNETMAAVTQGHLAPKAMTNALRAMKTDGPENVSLIDSLVGASSSRAYSVNTGTLGKANRQLAEAWNAITDLHARRSSFYHEASKAGFDTAEKRAALLHDPQHARKLAEITRRSNKNMVDFGSMTPLEANTLRRAIFYYPWASRATIWSLRMLVEHPGKSFTLAQLAQVGAENAHKKIGPMPGWAERLGLVPVGEAKDGKISVLNPSSINTPGTAAQLGTAAVDTVRAAIGLKHGTSGFGDVATPSISVLAGLTSRDTTSSTGLRAIMEGHPLYALGKRAGLYGKPSATYPDTGTKEAVGPYVAGGLFPRKISQEALAKQATKEDRAELSPIGRALDDGRRLRQTYLEAARQAFPDTLPDPNHLPPTLSKAIIARTKRQAAYAKAGKDLSQRDRFAIDVSTALSMGVGTPDQAQQALQWSKTAREDQIRLARLRMGHDIFGGDVISAAKKALNEKGAKITVP